VFIEGPQILDIVVDFYVPDVPVEAKDKVGRAYATAYEQLYDEDVAMMVERQQQLDLRVEGFDRSETLRLEAASELILPTLVKLSQRSFVLNQIAGEWVAYSAQCPHQMGPLIDSPIVEGEVRCPWHGFTFNVLTGECTSGAVCQLTEAPLVAEASDGTLLLKWADT
jgi:nitrite reductase/ring-hydroxylating ferredoxin subunit